MNSSLSIKTKEKSKYNVLIGLLCLVMIDWNGYGYLYFYIPLFYYICIGGLRNLDINFKLLLLFGVTYSLIHYLNYNTIRYAYNILPVLNFPIMYLMGRSLGYRYDENKLLLLIWTFAISLSVLAIISVYYSYQEEGFSIIGRDVSLVGYTNSETDFLYSATSLYSKLLPLNLFLFFLFVDSKYKWIFFISGIIAFICAVRLQIRSAIYVASVSLVIPLLLGKGINAYKKIIGVVFIIGAVAFVLTYYSDELLIIDRFQVNEAINNHGTESRFDLAQKTAELLSTRPLGGIMNERYAHNLWIDSARVSGWIPFFVLMILTYRWLKTTIKIAKESFHTQSFRTFTLVFSICLFLYFNTEPILEGAPMLFSLFCLYLGIITSRAIKR